MESDSEKIIGLYERHAQAYVTDRRLVGWREHAWLDRFTALLRPGSTILDIGCGSGEPIARYLLGQGFAVSGIDSSPTLIGLCRERLPVSSMGCWLGTASFTCPTRTSAGCFPCSGNMRRQMPR